MSDERARAWFAKVVAFKTRSPYRFCVYCGHPCYGLTCKAHRDLLNADANYNEARS